MTEEQAIDKVLLIARTQIGAHEGANNWNMYAAWLDRFPNLFWAGSKQNQPWCATFDVYLFVKAFGLDLAMQMLCVDSLPCGLAACKFGADYFRRAGRFFSEPMRGNIIFYGPTGNEEHQGIVEKVAGGTVTTIEGNWTDTVCRREVSIRDPRISGYGRPRWDLAAKEPPIEYEDVSDPDTELPQASDAKAYTIELREIVPGDSGIAVERLQALLIARGYYCGGRRISGREVPDGDYGPATETAVKDVQLASDLPQNGIVDARTMLALLTT